MLQHGLGGLIRCWGWRRWMMHGMSFWLNQGYIKI